MNIKKKILMIAVGPVLMLGVISIFFISTQVRKAVISEIEEALKGTAAATLAAYDQNAGDYIQSTNGDIWKGSYNISKSESLVDKIKSNSGMDVTFFYGDERIMTSAKDANGDRVLGSRAGDKIVEKVLKGGEEYFSSAVSIEGELNYGYFMPVHQNNSDNQIIGMIFVGTNLKEKEAVVKLILGSISSSVIVVMLICIAVGIKLAGSMSRNIKKSIQMVGRLAEGNLDVWVDDKLLKKKDEIGELSRVTITLRDTMRSTIKEITDDAKALLEASQLLGTAADNTNGTMKDVRTAVSQVVDNSQLQAENSQSTSEQMKIMGDNITETSNEAELLSGNAASMQLSSEKASKTLLSLRQINEDVKKIIGEVQEQTNRTNESVKKIQAATTFINSIAEDTGLLSLNASIEAARAGDSGRGFAVVAEQIKNLSEQSNESSKEIEATAEVLRADSEKAVQAMQQMQEIIASQSESMQETQQVVAEVIEEIASSMKSIAQIKESSGRLEGARNEVLQAVEHLSEISAENLDSTKSTYEQTEIVADTFKQVYNSADELKTIADKLVKSIEYFKM
ncbi:MAG TPA: methyl-accepting chemotaxis protein [Eubacterium sp.]|nr:methyl-accepting chemotaxis protein [Eubacterium sp.]HAZ86811.1 methyl-accepting chemotaxis protein [Eubacterium sp.]